MKLLSFMTTCCILGSSLFAALPQIDPPFILEKDCHHHRGPRGPRGHRGHHGHRGNTGPQGSAGPQGSTGPQGTSGAPAAYIGMNNTNRTLISGDNVIVPLGQLDTGVNPVLLQYIDTDPLDLTADRYVQVLPGGAGQYIVNYSVLAATMQELGALPLMLQLQVNNGSGYDTTSIPINWFEGHRAFFGGDIFFLGSAEVIVSLQDNDKIHLAQIYADINTILGPFNGSDQVAGLLFTMHRIDSPSNG